MKRLFFSILFVSILMMPVFVSGETWQIDPDHSSFQFRVRHMTVSNVKGEFHKAAGTVVMNDNDIDSIKIEIKIEIEIKIMGLTYPPSTAPGCATGTANRK